MEPALFDRYFTASLALGLGACTASNAQTEPSPPSFSQAVSPEQWAQGCEPWDDWDKPALPFRVHGNTYYVGTCGIASILVVTEEGNVLIDSGTERGADVVIENISHLGVDPAAITTLLHSHEHFDHIGGMGFLEEHTGAQIWASPLAALVMINRNVLPEDPQFGMHDPMREITNVEIMSEGRRVDFPGGLTSISTPGHSPGALSWFWESCEGSVCKTIVYADSLSPVSSDDYRFSDHPEYLAAYREGLANLAALECDILLTPHPSHSRMVERAATGTFEGGMTCTEYANGKITDIEARLTREAGANP